jgi:hypothetical protein
MQKKYLSYEITATAIATAMGINKTNIPRRVLKGELPAPARILTGIGGFRWRLSDIHRVNPALAATIAADLQRYEETMPKPAA